MIPASRWNAVVLPLAALFAAAVASDAPAAGPKPKPPVVKPFAISGAGTGPFGLPLPGQAPRAHWAAGTATDLGRYVGVGSVRTDSAVPDPAEGRIVGEFGSGTPFVFIGENRDRLVCNYGRVDRGASEPGTFELAILGFEPDGSLLVQAFWVAEFVTVGEVSTGKFAGVSGSWIMYAQSEPFVLGSSDPVDYSWEGQGTLTYRR